MLKEPLSEIPAQCSGQGADQANVHNNNNDHVIETLCKLSGDRTVTIRKGAL
jgi:hypothetical protein